MVYLYRIWADNTRSFLGMFERTAADIYVNRMGGQFEYLPVRIVNVK